MNRTVSSGGASPISSGGASPISRGMLGRHGRLGAWCGLLLLGLWAFGGPLGRRIGAPGLTTPRTWATWSSGQDPTLVTMAVLQLVVVAVTGYLLVATVLAWAAEMSESRLLVRASDLLVAAGVRRAVRATVGTGLVMAMAAGPLTVNRPTTSPTTPVAAAADPVAGDTSAPEMRRLPDQPHVGLDTAGSAPTTLEPPRVTPPRTAAPDKDEPTRPEPSDQDPIGKVAQSPALADTPSAATSTAAPATTQTPTPATAEYRVQPGDHLWGIAATHLSSAGSDTVTDADVVPYWQQVIEHNRDRLVDPGNPDLIVPGQVLVLPELP